MVALTQKQKEDLNQAIVEYLITNKYTESAAAFQKEAGVTYQESVTSSNKDMLEKKWTSLAKMKKQIWDLEKTIKQLKENSASSPDSRQDQFKGGDGLPKEPEKYSMAGHRAKVTKVAMHPLYNQVASASEDATIRIWDFDQGEHERTLKGHAGIVKYLAFHQNGLMLASCATDMAIKLWNLQTFSVQKTLTGHTHEVSGLSFIPSHPDFLISCSRDQSIRIWDTLSGGCLFTLMHTDWVKRVSVSATGSLFATAGSEEAIIVWTTEFVLAGKPAELLTLNGHEHQIDCLKWASLEAARTIEHSEYAGGLFQIKTQDVDVKEEDEDQEGGGTQLTTMEKIQQLKADLLAKREAIKNGGNEEAKDAEVIPADQVRNFLASGSRDKSIKVWDVKVGKCVATLLGHDNWVTDLCFHPNGRFLISVSDDKSMRVWDLLSGRCTRKLLNIHSHFCTSIAIKNRTIVTSSVDQTVKVWSCR